MRVLGEDGDTPAALAADGIESRRWYCPPLHRHPAFGGLERAGEPPVSEMLDGQLVGLPFHAFLTPVDVARIVASLQRVVNGRAPDAEPPYAAGASAASG